MAKHLQRPLSFFIIVAAVYWALTGNMPSETEDKKLPSKEFSTSRAFGHVAALAKEPHFTGSSGHSKVRNYIVSQLQEMGLFVQTQEDFSLTKHGVLTRPRNILARIKGTGKGKALLLMSHYDSAVHSSPGASDAGSGVGTILEGIRAFLASGVKPQNDIIVLFTDAEELSLNGAHLFVKDHPWAKEVTLALNFEARGSGGESFMLLETNKGNKKLMEGFLEANPEFPVANSLSYSIYKMLPNDTDLTVLREEGNINGFNFAFIGDHFDYHTATDLPENLDKKTLAHQGSYLVALLDHFSKVSLEDLESREDLIYFNLPVFKLVMYPFSWIYPMLVLSLLIFSGLLVYGIRKRRLHPLHIVKGFLPLLVALFLSGLLTYGLWKFCLFIYSQYLEMEQGFPYNGYYYIAVAIFLSLSISFYVYSRFKKTERTASHFVAPLVIWFFVSSMAAVYLKGAAYFIVPVLFGLLQLFVLIRQRKPNLALMAFLSVPSIFIIVPFLVNFPVALGLGLLFGSALLTVLLWSLHLPVFGFYRKNQSLGFFCFLAFFILFVLAHLNSDFNSDRPKPNSLVYLFDADTGTATWNSYDKIPDPWIAPYIGKGTQPKNVKVLFSSKYNSGFNKSAKAPVKNLREPYIQIQKTVGDSLGTTWYIVKIAPNRPVHRMEFFTEEIVDFENFKVNGLEADGMAPGENPLHVFKKRWAKRLLSYYPVGRDTLKLEFEVSNEKLPEIILYEASHDLLENADLGIVPREKGMIPRPFVLNDAVVIKKTIKLE